MFVKSFVLEMLPNKRKMDDEYVLCNRIIFKIFLHTLLWNWEISFKKHRLFILCFHLLTCTYFCIISDAESIFTFHAFCPPHGNAKNALNTVIWPGCKQQKHQNIRHRMIFVLTDFSYNKINIAIQNVHNTYR